VARVNEYIASICAGVFGRTSLRFELHGGREFFVLGAQLGFEQEELLDLLHAGELLVHAVHLGLDQRLHLGRRVRLA
jgi:hypothetical protein